MYTCLSASMIRSINIFSIMVMMAISLIKLPERQVRVLLGTLRDSYSLLTSI